MRRWGCAIGVLLAVACGEPEPDGSVTRESVADFLRDYNSAFAAADTSRIRELYVPDDRLVWLEDGVVKYRSVADIFESLAALPPGSRAETELDDPQVTVLGDGHAAVSAGFATAFTSAEGEGFAFSGGISMVLERTDGRWRVLSGHTSTARQGWGSP